MKQLLDRNLSGARRAGVALFVLVASACGVVEHPQGDAQAVDTSDDFGPSGGTPVATFWTLVPVAPDGAIITRPDGPLAFNSTRVARATDGSLQLYVSRTLSPRNWLEITGDGPFALVLTLYDTSSLTGVGSGPASLPAIIREACR